ncbi:MAG: hypothetical protein HOG49_25200 [Candidatus Scalindua sp.]|jgi:hypothetical protein|nr:hypothetical protein [Candidatus Scalindua sp.]
MKIRNGFVSNSSSSSFICEICGDSEVGYDSHPTDLVMEFCEHGHLFCKGHLGKIGKKITYKEDDCWYGGDAVTEDCCPICTLKNIDDSLLLRYLNNKFSTTKKEIIDEIQRDFKDIGELDTYLEEQTLNNVQKEKRNT